jgi:hypothetical protein
MTEMTDKAAARVAIVHHPDVRRSLMTQKAYAEGLRALYVFTTTFQDAEVAVAVHDVAPELAARVNDLLLPVVKGVGSERAYQCLAESLQTLGGSGYLRDYPIEQYIRDAKIDSLYEGTTAIQALDFFFRKIVRDQGAAFDYLLDQIATFVKGDSPATARISSARERLDTALVDVRDMAATLTGHLMAAQDDRTHLYGVGLGSVRFLMSVGDLIIGWLLLRQAETAISSLELGAVAEERAFYEGKVAVATFFAGNVLPLLTGTRATLASLDLDVMKLDVESL